MAHSGELGFGEVLLSVSADSRACGNTANSSRHLSDTSASSPIDGARSVWSRGSRSGVVTSRDRQGRSTAGMGPFSFPLANPRGVDV